MIQPATAAPVEPGLDLFAAIDRLRREMNAVVLAHYYQEPDIQDVADFIGDSLALSQQAAATDAEVIVFAGVHFMAETAKILNPDKQVLLPDLAAGCSLADGCPADEFAAFLARYPGHKVVSYINCSAATKAQSDVICTSSNAVKIVGSFPADQPMVFAPDRFLGAWVVAAAGPGPGAVAGVVRGPRGLQREEAGGAEDLPPRGEGGRPPRVPRSGAPARRLRGQHHAASWTSPATTDAPAVIVVTEPGILHQMQKENPGKELIPVPGADESCSCNECPYMKKNTLEKLYLCMRDRTPEITVDPHVAARALRAHPAHAGAEPLTRPPGRRRPGAAMTVRTPVYLDHHATTPPDPRVLAVLRAVQRDHWGNAASAGHAFGWAAARLVERGPGAGGRPGGRDAREIVFTSGATEADNLAVLGVAAALGERRAPPGDHQPRARRGVRAGARPWRGVAGRPRWSKPGPTAWSIRGRGGRRPCATTRCWCR